MDEIETLFNQEKYPEAFTELKKIADYPNVFASELEMMQALRMAVKYPISPTSF